MSEFSKNQFRTLSSRVSFPAQSHNPQVGRFGIRYVLKPISYVHGIGNFQASHSLAINKLKFEEKERKEVRTYTVRISDLFSEKIINKLDKGLKATDLMTGREKILYNNSKWKFFIESIVKQMYETQTKGFEDKITPEFKSKYMEWLTLVTIRMFNEIPEQ